jgi:hypothetical protein
MPHMQRSQRRHLVPIGDTPNFDQLCKVIDIHTGATFFRGEDKAIWIGCLPGQLLALRVKPCREEEELLVLKLKTPTPLVNAALAQNEAHRASAERLTNVGPFFESDRVFCIRHAPSIH